jgi:hypothetical protein
MAFSTEDRKVGMKGKVEISGRYKERERIGPRMAVPGLCSVPYQDLGTKLSQTCLRPCVWRRLSLVRKRIRFDQPQVHMATPKL